MYGLVFIFKTWYDVYEEENNPPGNVERCILEHASKVGWNLNYDFHSEDHVCFLDLSILSIYSPQPMEEKAEEDLCELMIPSPLGCSSFSEVDIVQNNVNKLFESPSLAPFR